MARRDEMPHAPAFLSAQPVLCMAQGDSPQGQPEPCAPTQTLWQVLSPTQPGKWFHRDGKDLLSNSCICRATFGTLRQVLSLPLPLLMGVAGISNADGKTACGMERAKMSGCSATALSGGNRPSPLQTPLLPPGRLLSWKEQPCQTGDMRKKQVSHENSLRKAPGRRCDVLTHSAEPSVYTEVNSVQICTLGWAEIRITARV